MKAGLHFSKKCVSILMGPGSTLGTPESIDHPDLSSGAIIFLNDVDIFKSETTIFIILQVQVYCWFCLKTTLFKSSWLAKYMG